MRKWLRGICVVVLLLSCLLTGVGTVAAEPIGEQTYRPLVSLPLGKTQIVDIQGGVMITAEETDDGYLFGLNSITGEVLVPASFDGYGGLSKSGYALLHRLQDSDSETDWTYSSYVYDCQGTLLKTYEDEMVVSFSDDVLEIASNQLVLEGLPVCYDLRYETVDGTVLASYTNVVLSTPFAEGYAAVTYYPDWNRDMEAEYPGLRFDVINKKNETVYSAHNDDPNGLLTNEGVMQDGHMLLVNMDMTGDAVQMELLLFDAKTQTVQTVDTQSWSETWDLIPSFTREGFQYYYRNGRMVVGDYETQKYSLIRAEDGAVLCTYDELFLSEGAYLLAYKGDRWCYVDWSGQELGTYLDASEFFGEQAMVLDENGAYLIDTEFKRISEYLPADCVSAFGDGYYLLLDEEYNTTLVYEAAKYAAGDVNGDTIVNSKDARLVLQNAVGTGVLSPLAKAAADVNGDSVIDSRDARSILQTAVA